MRLANWYMGSAAAGVALMGAIGGSWRMCAFAFAFELLAVIGAVTFGNVEKDRP